MPGIELRSSAFNDHDLMPERLSKLGGNVSPPLTWSGVPEGTAELALMVEDPDGGAPFLHWLVTGIDPAATEVPEGRVPSRGAEWVNSFGNPGWGGPQPPKGDNQHRYFFRLHALSGPLQVPDRPDVERLHRAIADRELASGTLVGTFAR